MQVDVIIPTYNRSHVLERAIHSVLNQSYKNFSLYIVDDGSTDETQKLLQKFSSHLTILSQKNAGVSAARNLGVINSQAPWISFLDSDDEWLPHKLETQIKFLKENPHLRFVHSNEIWIRNGVRVNAKQKFNKSGPDLFQRSLEFCVISPSTTLMARDLFLAHGGFGTDYTVCEDYDLWLKILTTEEIGFVPDELIKKYGGHKDQLSTKYVAMDEWRIKSLISLLKASQTRQEERSLIKEVIQKKSEILMKGYEKHAQNEKLSQLRELLKTI